MIVSTIISQPISDPKAHRGRLHHAGDEQLPPDWVSIVGLPPPPARRHTTTQPHRAGSQIGEATTDRAARNPDRPRPRRYARCNEPNSGISASPMLIVG